MVDIDRRALTSRLRERLVKEANPTGGWAYYPGKRSRIEPTSWTLLALAETWPQESGTRSSFLDSHLQFLSGCQRKDGLLTEISPASINFTTNGLAACVVTSLASEADAELLRRLTAGIVSVKGVAGENDPSVKQDNHLQGWPWLPETFSWVEPTSWCLLALKKTRARSSSRQATARIQEAEKLLADRACKAGGWNYGNASVFGQDLRAYVPTTAVGLLAMQDHRTDAVVVNALAQLESIGLKEASGMALALTAICLRLYGRPTDDVEGRLATAIARAERVGNLQTLAMALYALSGERHEVKALRV